MPERVYRPRHEGISKYREGILAARVMFRAIKRQIPYVTRDGRAHAMGARRDLLRRNGEIPLRRRSFSGTCGVAGLISPQNRPRIYRRGRERNYFSSLGHENELNYAAKVRRQMVRKFLLIARGDVGLR